MIKQYLQAINRAESSCRPDLARSRITNFKVRNEIWLNSHDEVVVEHIATAKWKGQSLRAAQVARFPNDFTELTKVESQASKVVTGLAHHIWRYTYNPYD